ncbi:MAG: YfcE family phosphodiesterase [Deltaproteobacteria bacterium]|nr:MAG: YfcE family phosphodiesterase [Deltaproteobacteria bacterium]
MFTIGILSDTHLQAPDSYFKKICRQRLGGCDAIVHAGDLIDISVLDVFCEKEVYAVHGNSCNARTRAILPERRVFEILGYTIALCHGTGPRHNIEDRVFSMFPDADCIVYGHSHQAACNRYGSCLLVNPGSFQATSRYGHPGSYALLRIDGTGLHSSLHSLAED